MHPTYLCHPYSNNPDENLYWARKLTHKLFAEGWLVYSPVTSALALKREENYSQLLIEDLHWMTIIQHVTLFKLPGWEESKGVSVELAWARAFAMPVREIEQLAA